MIDIKGLDKADVLAALYNASRPQGLGFIQAGAAGPFDMTRDEAAATIAGRGEQVNFDYLKGRPLKVDLTGSEFEPFGYDRDNGGPGAAQRVIDRLRSEGSIRRADGSSFADDTMSPEESQMFAIGALNQDATRP